MMKKFLAFTFLTLSTLNNFKVQAQQPDFVKNICYLEFLGAADIYGINYERIIRYNQTIRVGVSFLPENWYNGGSSEKKLLSFPVSYQYLVGKSSHKLALSGGLLAGFILNKNAPTQFKLNPNIGAGYRYQRSNQGLFVGCMFYVSPPLFLTADRDDLILFTGKSYLFSPGGSLGWIF
jgi:hypothetical protein